MAKHTISPAGEPFQAALHDERPHACIDGWVSMEVEVIDPETGEEIREEALYLYRLCTDSR